MYLASAAQAGAWPWRRGEPDAVYRYPAKGVAVGLVALSLTWDGVSMPARTGLYQNPRQPYFYYDARQCVEPALNYVAKPASPNDPVLFAHYAGTRSIFYAPGCLPKAARWHHTDLIDDKAEFEKWLDTIGTRGWMVCLDDAYLHRLDWVERKKDFTRKKVFTERGANIWLLEPLRKAAGDPAGPGSR